MSILENYWEAIGDAHRSFEKSAVSKKMTHHGAISVQLQTMQGTVLIFLDALIHKADSDCLVNLRNAIVWHYLKDNQSKPTQKDFCSTLEGAFGCFWGSQLKSQMMLSFQKEIARAKLPVGFQSTRPWKNRAKQAARKLSKKADEREEEFVGPPGTPTVIRQEELMSFKREPKVKNTFIDGTGSESGISDGMKPPESCPGRFFTEADDAHSSSADDASVAFETSDMQHVVRNVATRGRRWTSINDLGTLPELPQDDDEFPEGTEDCEEVQVLANLFLENRKLLFDVNKQWNQGLNLDDAAVLECRSRFAQELELESAEVLTKLAVWVRAGTCNSTARALAVGLRHRHSTLLRMIDDSEDDYLLTTVQRALILLDELIRFDPTSQEDIASSLLNQKYSPNAPHCVAAYAGLCGVVFARAARGEGHWAHCGFGDKGSKLECVVSILVETVRYWKSRNAGVLHEAIWALSAIHEGCSMRPAEVIAAVEAAQKELEKLDHVNAYAQIHRFFAEM
eukprot:TRINITY_DN23528_c0_g5_i1.p1 TRINITY_DN23528_c0_g5~~TRINITY_DN23528_c0_g5_i1.p1  ORF type:complete len:510 (-),score=93.38 TRINITY_DN23528_c0_g5_i1:409-1938(-)